jgi:four helix bundle protein
MIAENYSGLEVFQLAFEQAMYIFNLTRKFPREEIYSLTDQIRRSSRSVCANLGEGYRKRQYPSHFTSKISDADMENTETQIWLRFVLECNYLLQEQYDQLIQRNHSIGKLLNHMISHPEKYQRKPHQS